MWIDLVAEELVLPGSSTAPLFLDNGLGLFILKALSLPMMAFYHNITSVFKFQPMSVDM